MGFPLTSMVTRSFRIKVAQRKGKKNEIIGNFRR